MSVANPNPASTNMVAKNVDESNILSFLSTSRGSSTTTQNALLSLNLLKESLSTEEEKNIVNDYIREQVQYLLMGMQALKDNPEFQMAAGGLTMTAAEGLASYFQKRGNDKLLDRYFGGYDNKLAARAAKPIRASSGFVSTTTAAPDSTPSA